MSKNSEQGALRASADDLRAENQRLRGELTRAAESMGDAVGLRVHINRLTEALKSASVGLNVCQGWLMGLGRPMEAADADRWRDEAYQAAVLQTCPACGEDRHDGTCIDLALGEARGTASASESLKEQGAPEGASVDGTHARDVAANTLLRAALRRLLNAVTTNPGAAETADAVNAARRLACECPCHGLVKALEAEQDCAHCGHLLEQPDDASGTAPTAPLHASESSPPAPDLLRENARLREDRDYFKTAYTRKLDDEKRALEAAQDALAKNAALADALEELLAERDNDDRDPQGYVCPHCEKARAALRLAGRLP